MGDMKGPLNFFSDSEKKKKIEVDPAPKTNVRADPQNPLKPAQHPPQPHYTIDSKIAAMLDRMAQMQADIDNKIEEAIHKHGITRAQLDNYLNDPKNFTPEQNEFIRQSRESFTQKIWSTVQLPPDTAPVATTPTSAKRSKPKSIGAHRNWISTR